MDEKTETERVEPTVSVRRFVQTDQAGVVVSDVTIREMAEAPTPLRAGVHEVTTDVGGVEGRFNGRVRKQDGTFETKR